MNKTTKPLIDVIIPAYNCSATLDRTLSSLAAQTNSNFHVILVDDCSTENLKMISDHYKRLLHITYLRNPHNLGCGMSRQTGIDHSTAPYLTFLDADDVMMPYTMEVFYQNIRKSPETVIFHSHFYHTDANGRMHSMTDGFTWCHGRLYQRKFLDRYKIRNLPDIKYCDDSFFNSLCDELNPEPLKTIPLPMMMWLYNERSVTRNTTGTYKEHCLSDFLHGIRRAVEFLTVHKPLEEIFFLDGTLDYAAEVCKKLEGGFSPSEKALLMEELSLLETLLAPSIPSENFRKLFPVLENAYD